MIWEEDGLPKTEGDLLNSIFELIGTPNDDDLKFISDGFAIAYIKKFAQREAQDFEQIFPDINPEGLKLVKSMLSFNPFFRPTAEECLQSPYFEAVKNFSKVKTAKKKVKLNIETQEEIHIKELRSEFNLVIN